MKLKLDVVNKDPVSGKLVAYVQIKDDADAKIIETFSAQYDPDDTQAFEDICRQKLTEIAAREAEREPAATTITTILENINGG